MLVTDPAKLSVNHQETRPLFAAVIIVVLLCTTLYGSIVAPKLVFARSWTSKPITGVAVARTAKLVRIHGGTFEMGTDASNIPRLQRLYGVGRADLFSAEVPRHKVTVSPFSIDAYAVTNARFMKFVDKNPQWTKERIAARLQNGNYLKHWNGDEYPKGTADHPVVNVSWFAAVAFCHWDGKRLPTEAEWEYAARGGLNGKEFPWGDENATPMRANYSSSGIRNTSAVGSYAPNGYGLFDMAGNVWEFLADEWGPYNPDAQIDPVAGGNLFLDDSFLTVHTRRVIRGGSWGGSPVNLRVAYRDSHPPEDARDFVGFRCAQSPQRKKPK